MLSTQSLVVGAGLFFLFIFLSGIWLTRSGKPYSGAVLTVHKLVSLAAVVLFIVALVRTNREATLSTIELSAGVVTGLLFLGTIVTGGLLSTDKPMPEAVLTLHRISPPLTVISTAVALYFLLPRK